MRTAEILYHIAANVLTTKKTKKLKLQGLKKQLVELQKRFPKLQSSVL
jgi:hypothetical protein